MSGPCCGREAGDPARPKLVRRGGEVVRWIVPSVLLALVPKCPACLAAYIALWTGLGLSFETAEWVRWVLIGLCILALVYLAATRGRRGILRLFKFHRS